MLITKETLLSLVDSTIISIRRRTLYRAAIEALEPEEYLEFGLSLWEMYLTKLEAQYQLKEQEMVEEMGTSNGTVTYTQDDFEDARKDLITQMIAKRSTVTDKTMLEELRSQLLHLDSIAKE